ncbi:MAG: glyoxalase [Ferrovum sp. 34-44-207]|nr:MAG: glyoxalase [Ferrovum sp. 34-44-207]HQT74216.1 VOC family protein [Acidiphilium sp.]
MTRQKSAPKASASVSDLIIRPHHTALSVEDFETVRDFLTNVVGMHLENEMDHRDESALGTVVGLPGAVIRWALLELSGYRIELFKYYKPKGVLHPIRQCDIGLTHICFQVSDVSEVHRRLTAAGYESISTPQALRDGRSKPFYLIGPAGIVIEFLELSA